MQIHLKQDTKILFVDFFDTLVSRNIHPEYVKFLASKKILDHYHINFDVENLYKKRAEFERSACEQNRTAGFDAEFSILKMHEDTFEFLKNHSRDFRLNIQRESFIQKCIDFELDIEMQVQEPNWGLIKEIEKIDIPKYIVSDFYIPAPYFNKLLEYHGISNLFKKVYVSSNFLLTKNSGNLYRHILKTESLEEHKCMMIGDNLHSDYITPQKIGINAHYLKSEKHKIYKKLFRLSTDKKRKTQDLEIKMFQVLAQYDETPFKEFSFTLYYFTAKLFNQLRLEQKSHILFCSKEGYFLKELFDLYQDFINPIKRIKTSYYYVSRRATFAPSLKNLDDETFEALLRQYSIISPKEFLLSLNFSDKEIQTVFNEMQNIEFNIRLNINEFIAKLRTSLVFKALYDNKRFEQRMKFTIYTDSLVGLDTTKEVCICDVGWKGTIQDNIAKAFPDKTITGYYIGYIDKIRHPKKSGILFENIAKTSSQSNIVFGNYPSLCEILLGAPNESTFQYQDGKPVLEFNEKDTKFYFERISPLQKQYTQIFTNLHRHFEHTHFQPEDFGHLFLKFHGRMMFSPNQLECDFINRTKHFENFGLFEYTHAGEASRGLTLFVKTIYNVFFARHKVATPYKGKFIREHFGSIFARLYYHFKMRNIR